MKRTVCALLTLALTALLLTACGSKNSYTPSYSSNHNYSSSSSGNKNNGSASSSSSNTNYFSQLSFGKPSIKTGKINDTIYVTVKNNSSVTLSGSIKAYIYYKGNIMDSAILFLPNDGLLPGDSATIDGIFNTVSGQWDDITFQASTLSKKR